jgi:Na+/melibiose symporter-like transporter
MRFLKALGRFFLSFGGTILRMGIIGVVMVGILVNYIDDFQSKSYGTNNLVLISVAFAGIPLFLALFVEFIIRGYRKQKKKKSKLKNVIHNQKG